MRKQRCWRWMFTARAAYRRRRCSTSAWTALPRSGGVPTPKSRMICRDEKSRVRIGHGFFFGQFEGRIQAVSGQFGCPDFLYHWDRKRRCAMDQQFAIAGYTGSSCLMCAIDGADIWQVDYFGNRQQIIGKTAAAYTELEGTTQQYYDKLVELGIITPPKTQEELMGEMQSAMSDMAEIIKGLSAQVKELKENGSQADHSGRVEDVPQRRPAKRGAEGGAGDQRDG
nr:MAG TPA: hypothetical protein [Caudoviricetes sp.]